MPSFSFDNDVHSIGLDDGLFDSANGHISELVYFNSVY